MAVRPAQDSAGPQALSTPLQPPAAPIESLPGLGPASRAMLAAAGIHTVDQLRALGAVKAYAWTAAANPGKASLNLLWALEGALSGCDWREVARTGRTRLLLELEDYLEHGR